MENKAKKSKEVPMLKNFILRTVIVLYRDQDICIKTL